MTKRIFLVCFASLLIFTGCGSKQKPEEKPAAVLIEEGLAQFDKGDHREAIATFTKIKDWYPFSKHAITAELKTADAHYALKEYDEAIMAYESFVNLHPRNEAAPYVIYQIGQCYLDQMRKIDQDQTSAQKAHDTFQRLLKQFPDSPYTRPAEEGIKTCRKSIIAHELYIAKFYFKGKHYKAALKRFNGILSMYPDVGAQYEALGYIALCESSLALTEAVEAKKKAEAPEMKKVAITKEKPETK
jgi:outer membrane protein assembly factor BamD